MLQYFAGENRRLTVLTASFLVAEVINLLIQKNPHLYNV